MNILSIKRSVQSAIDKVPSAISLKRYEKISDGAGGYTLSQTPTDVATFNALFDNSGHSQTLIILESAKVKRTSGIRLIVVYDDSFSMKDDDFFILDGVKYKVKNPANVLNLNIYWDCELEVVS